MNKNIEFLKPLLKKLLSDKLSNNEKLQLIESELVENAMKQQWNSCSDVVTDSKRGDVILDKIHSKVDFSKRTHFRMVPFIQRYAMAASIALLLLCGTLSYFLVQQQNRTQKWYVVNSGRQSMESVLLPDGTTVMLNAGSKITYPEKFTGEKREVLLSGQAFFNVHHDKAHPFIVKTKQMDITALGTAFEVFSFDGDANVETILLSGKIKVEQKDTNDITTRVFVLHPNEKISIADGRAAIVEKINADNYSAWRTGGKLCFKNEKLSMILIRLEKWYGQKIDCSEKISGEYRFTFTVRNEPLDLILSIMSQSAPIGHIANTNGYMLKEIRK